MSDLPPGGVPPVAVPVPPGSVVLVTRGDRRCTYTGCDRPEHGTDFHHIEAGRRSGGQDWTALAGSTLCNACYQQYKRRGTLERSRNKPIATGSRRCTYPNCEKPDHGSKFFLIEQGKNTADKDWSSIVGMVLCKACYQQYIRSGKLERSRNKPLMSGARRCSYYDCDRPEHGSCFYQIEAGKTAGGQDWTGLVGQVLCKACYEQYKTRGTLERTGRVAATAPASKATAAKAVEAAPAVTAAPVAAKHILVNAIAVPVAVPGPPGGLVMSPVIAAALAAYTAAGTAAAAKRPAPVATVSAPEDPASKKAKPAEAVSAPPGGIAS